MKKILTLLSIFAGCSISYAQPPEGSGPNLVPDSGFEEVKGKRPKDDLDGSGAFRYNMVHWRSPTSTTPDLKIVLPQEITKARREGREINEPHNGYMMVAILTDHKESDRSDTYREYVQTKLLEPTKEGAEYYYEFWACRAVRSKYISNNLGMVLSPTPIYQDGWEPLDEDIKPDVNVDSIVNKDGRQWVKISGTLTSANRSEFLILGNFFHNEKTTVIEAPNPGDFNLSYYLIDDVILHELNYQPEPEPEPVAAIQPEPDTIVATTFDEEPLEVGGIIKLDRVFFVTAKWDLLDESFEQLDELVTLLNNYPSMEIAVHGHTDSRGTEDYNLDLSHNRAKEVYEYLINQGIEEMRLDFEGFGEGKPIADNRYADGRQLNRRVEFVITRLDDENTTVEHANEVKPYTDKD